MTPERRLQALKTLGGALVTPIGEQIACTPSAKRGEGQRFPVVQPHATPFPADQEEKMCRSKRRYPSKRDAVTAINLFRRHRGRHGRPQELRAYPCPICRGWHLTKSGKGKKGKGGKYHGKFGPPRSKFKFRR